MCVFFFFQAEDGIRDLVRSRGLGDVYKRQDKVLEIGTGSGYQTCILLEMGAKVFSIERQKELFDKTKDLLSSLAYSPKLFYGDGYKGLPSYACLLYTSDAADERSSVDLGGRRIIKKKKKKKINRTRGIKSRKHQRRKRKRRKKGLIYSGSKR